MVSIIVMYTDCANIEGTEFTAPVYYDDNNNIVLCNCLAEKMSLSKNLDVIYVDKVNSKMPYVSKVNRYGFYEISNGKRVSKRHISYTDPSDVYKDNDISGLILVDSHYVIARTDLTQTDREVYFIRYIKDDVHYYLSRVPDGNEKYTTDITKAWFSFNKRQVENYAQKEILKSWLPLECVSATEEIQLVLYRIEDKL